MIIHLNMSITLDVPEEHAKQILDNNKSALLMTIFNGNSAQHPEFGKWYPEGSYTIGSAIHNSI